MEWFSQTDGGSGNLDSHTLKGCDYLVECIWIIKKKKKKQGPTNHKVRVCLNSFSYLMLKRAQPNRHKV